MSKGRISIFDDEPIPLRLIEKPEFLKDKITDEEDLVPIPLETVLAIEGIF